MPGQRRDGGVVVAERIGRPAHRPDRQRHPRRRLLVGLAERPGRAGGLSASPDPHQPADQASPGRSTARRAASGPGGRDPPPSPRTPDRPPPAAGLHRKHQPLPVIDCHVEDMHVGNIEDRIGPGAPARTRATHRVRHRRVLRESVAWSLLILKGPTSYPLINTPTATGLTHAQIRRAGYGEVPCRAGPLRDRNLPLPRPPRRRPMSTAAEN